MNFEPSGEMLDALAAGLTTQSWIVSEPLPEALLRGLEQRALEVAYQPAQVGRAQRRRAPQIRSDQIAWVTSENSVDSQWLNWLEALRLGLNRRLFLGLTQVESHYAWYPPGACYQRHRDAFSASGLSNRIVSLVLYLNPVWPEQAGGELMLYADEAGEAAMLQRLVPQSGRLVLFLSADVPHEVLPAQQHRYSLAAWFRAPSPN